MSKTDEEMQAYYDRKLVEIDAAQQALDAHTNCIDCGRRYCRTRKSLERRLEMAMDYGD